MANGRDMTEIESLFVTTIIYIIPRPITNLNRDRVDELHHEVYT